MHTKHSRRGYFEKFYVAKYCFSIMLYLFKHREFFYESSQKYQYLLPYVIIIIFLHNGYVLFVIEILLVF